ncbi:MAG: hypothetical protein WA987_03510 [Cellvibrio sp.]
MDELRGLVAGEVDHIVRHTSNHWRKVFNVCAKFLFDWQAQQPNGNELTCWQDYRDQHLFQSGSSASLLFSAPQLNDGFTRFHVVVGKTYAASLNLAPLVWVDQYFALNKEYRLIVSPYPDYRQLSNSRITTLINLMQSVANPT